MTGLPAAAVIKRCLVISFEKVLRFLTAASISTLLLAVLLLYRHFRRSAAVVPYAYHAAAVFALSLGILTVITGLGRTSSEYSGQVTV